MPACSSPSRWRAGWRIIRAPSWCAPPGSTDAVSRPRSPALAYFAFSFSQLMREGPGPGRPGAELEAIHSLLPSGEAGERVFDGHTLLSPAPLALPLEASGEPVSRVIVRFVTPTELKGAGQVLREPQFGVLLCHCRFPRASVTARARSPRELKSSGSGPWRRVWMRSLTRANTERRSGKTGQRHTLSVFVGEAEYHGALAEFIPYLKVASWTGVGRQTTWGKGHIEVAVE